MHCSRGRVPAVLRRVDFRDLCEDIIISGQVGVVKPDPEIVEVRRARIPHATDRCVFIDDGPGNIEAARLAGLDAILFTDPGHLRQDLLLRGLPLSPR